MVGIPSKFHEESKPESGNALKVLEPRSTINIKSFFWLEAIRRKVLRWCHRYNINIIIILIVYIYSYIEGWCTYKSKEKEIKSNPEHKEDNREIKRNFRIFRPNWKIGIGFQVTHEA